MMAILSDIHSNLAALQAVLADADAHGCTSIVSLGDVVGYLAEPGPCIDLLRERQALNIMGNHDSYVVGGTGCPRSKAVARIVAYQRTILSEAQIEWLARSERMIQDGARCFLHGGPHDPTDQYLYTIARDTIPAGVEWLFSGHTHVQTLIQFSGDAANQGAENIRFQDPAALPEGPSQTPGHRRHSTRIPLNDASAEQLRFSVVYYCNPGSVGQPRDGDPRAAYALFDGTEVRLRRVVYDIDRTANAMRSAGFDSYFYENLYAGAQIGGRVDRVSIRTDEASYGSD